MNVLKKDELERIHLPGRMIQNAVGKGAPSESSRMTFGFARFSGESGPMAPHHHAEETILILSAEDGWVRCGPSPQELGAPIPLEAGIVLHIPELEWHVFEYGEGGHVEIAFIYGQVENIRPEEMPTGANKG